ncbi:hypothetical protein KIN20_028354 [Parelaphostrongylus tenuis]|uniref:Uncharacterized protein n=1 Tax=Parelaphostrongylus tenuis TaxID=148309 RepID=A0AAD5R154_PARTN|nr:hypothetical protein KIN20_028353 [Parelaphostrongylus tenuis]KAJ1367444.1 hypothetical protein KIN20_028354 [Parelaphostrongylus tenuis]
MNVKLFVFLTVCIGAKSFSSIGSANGPSAKDDNYEKELNEGYELLKGVRNLEKTHEQKFNTELSSWLSNVPFFQVPHAKDTKWLLQQLHEMEPEIQQELTLSPEREAELQEEMKVNKRS